MSRVIGYAVWLGDRASWHGLVPVMMARLTVEERAVLAFAALRSLDDDTAYLTASTALFGTLDGEVAI